MVLIQALGRTPLMQCEHSNSIDPNTYRFRSCVMKWERRHLCTKDRLSRSEQLVTCVLGCGLERSPKFTRRWLSTLTNHSRNSDLTRTHLSWVARHPQTQGPYMPSTHRYILCTPKQGILDRFLLERTNNSDDQYDSYFRRSTFSVELQTRSLLNRIFFPRT